MLRIQRLHEVELAALIRGSEPAVRQPWNHLLRIEVRVIDVNALMLRGKEHMSVGHNAMAGFIYFFTFLAFLIQCLTGFGLYASMSTSWWFPKLFSWVPAMFGGDFFLREVHHVTMWFFILFTVIHVYLVFYHDYVEGRGEISSMGGGWKFVEEEVFDKGLDTPNEPKEPTKS